MAAREGAGKGTEETPRMETYHYSAASNPTLEDQLFELVRLSDVPMSKQLFDVVVELLRLNIPPSAVLHVMRTLRAQATHSTLPPSLQSSRVPSRTHSPPLHPHPPSSESTSTTRPHKEPSRPAPRKSHTSTTSTAKSTTSQQPLESDKSSRKQRHAPSTAGSQRASTRSTEKLKSSVKGGSSVSGKRKGHSQDPPKKVS